MPLPIAYNHRVSNLISRHKVCVNPDMYALSKIVVNHYFVKSTFGKDVVN